MKENVVYHLVKGEDLNHHGTLFAGRQAEWFVEAGFIAAALLTKPENIVCAQIHGMKFTRPVAKGEVVKYIGRIALVGRSKIVAHVAVSGKEDDDLIVEGFLTFVHVDGLGMPVAHGVPPIEANSEAECLLQSRAAAL